MVLSKQVPGLTLGCLIEQKLLVSKIYSLSKTMKYQRNMVSRIGFEPMTPSLKRELSDQLDSLTFLYNNRSKESCTGIIQNI